MPHGDRDAVHPPRAQPTPSRFGTAKFGRGFSVGRHGLV